MSRGSASKKPSQLELPANRELNGWLRQYSLMTTAADLDTQLMVRVQRDDDSSFGVLLTRNRGVVVNYLSRMVTNRAVAEELAQDVFVRVYRSRQRYQPTAKFSTWLYRIA